MSTFKTDLYEMCGQVAADFPGWSFGSGQFKTNALKHTELVVHLGLGFEQGLTPVCPSINIYNKKLSRLCRYIFSENGCASMVSMQVVAHTLKYLPEKLRTGFWIAQDKRSYLSLARPSEAVKDVTVDLAEARLVLVDVMRDAIHFIENHYDLSSENALLCGLPAKYTTRHVNSPYDQMEKMKGVMFCLVRILLGDFDFVENYRGDNYKTIYPKRIQDLNKIIDVVPELKRRFAETGTVI